MIRVTIHLTVAASLEMDCLYEVRKVIQTSSQQAIDDLRLQEVCPDLPDVQITNTTGVLKIENNNVSKLFRLKKQNEFTYRHDR